MPAARSYPPPSLDPAPLPEVPAKLQPPLKAPVARPKCSVKELQNGDLEVTFDIPASEYEKFKRQACGKPMEDFLWETRGLKHFKTQPIN
jgi:hypothetical protein